MAWFFSISGTASSGMNIPARVIAAMKINMGAAGMLPMNKVDVMNIIYTEEKKFTQEPWLRR